MLGNNQKQKHKKKQMNIKDDKQKEINRYSSQNNQQQQIDISSNQQQENQSQIFQQIDNVLVGNTQKISRKELLLKLKVDQLQRFCQDLAADNHRLTQKLQQILNQRQSKISQSAFVDQLSQIGTDFGQIQSLLKQYRNDLAQFQKKIKAEMTVKDKKIQQLNVQLAIVGQQNFKFKEKVFELEKKNKEYQYKIDTLQKEIKIIESKAAIVQSASKHQLSRTRTRKTSKDYKMQYQSPMSTSHRGSRLNLIKTNFNMMGMSNNFSQSVQQQLQILIEKLIHQLQHERSFKRKMNDQLKRLNHELYQSEQEIKNKNNKIYSLQLRIIKQQKAQLAEQSRITAKQQSLNYFNSNNVKKQQKWKRSITNSNKPMKSFTLNQLFNKQVKMTSKQKMLLLQKIFEYFLSKIEKNSFIQIEPQELMIFNYHTQNMNMISVRENSSIKQSRMLENQEGNIEQFVWNMAFILIKILNQVPDQMKKSGTYQTAKQNLNLLFAQVLQNKYQGSTNDLAEQICICLQQYFEQKTQLKATNYDLKMY